MRVQDHPEPGTDDPRSVGDLAAVPPVDRTCTELTAGSGAAEFAHRRSLSDLRDVPAYVLLGDPGAGKTTEFERESEALGDAAEFVSARDFVTLDPANHPEWQNTTLFIDGLDEMRAGAADGRLPLDEIRRRLDQLGRPKFRLSCREANWLGRSDRQALEAVATDGRVIVLRLEPLSRDAAEELLKRTGRVPDAATFQHEARRRGVDSMLDNPLTLRLLAAAVGQDGWPDGRSELFESACRKLSSEWNEEHQAAVRSAAAAPPSTEPGTLIDAAGHLCALSLLAGRYEFTLEPPTPAVSFESEAPVSASVSLADLREIPGVATQETMHAALATSLFRAEGGAAGRRFVPMHRQVAEFLAGRFLAGRLDDGLPAGRVVALMVSPTDARVVTPLCGLAAWLTAHSPQARTLLIESDPVGAARYGDVGRFTDEDKRRLLSALESLPAHEPVFDYERPSRPDATFGVSVGWAFRALASPGMVEPIRDLLGRRGPAAPDGRIELLVLDALSHAEESARGHLRLLLGELEERVRDDSRWPAIRQSALKAYRHILDDDERSEALRAILEEIRTGAVSDPDDELRGALLDALYPDAIRPSEVWRYLVPRRDRVYHGLCWMFWQQHLMERSSSDQIAELLDALHAEIRTGLFPVAAFDLRGIHVVLLARGLSAWGENIATKRLYRWLSIPITGHLRFEDHVFSEDALHDVRSWLEAHPESQKAVILARLRDRISHDEADSYYWEDFEILHGSRPPADFGLWCLARAVERAEAEPALSEELLRHAYGSLNEPALSEGLTLEVMRDRIHEQGTLARLLAQLCEPRVGRAHLVEESRDRRQIEEVRERREREDRQRRQEWAEHVLSHEKELRENRCPPRSLHQLAMAYLGLFSDLRGIKSSEGRLSKFLGGDRQAVDIVRAGLRSAVLRDDLPDVDETIKWHLDSRQPSLALPVLVSLQILDEEEPNVLDGLGAASKRRVLAMYFWSSATIHISTSWYRRWLQQSPGLVLDVLQGCALAAIRNGAELPHRLRAVESENREAHPCLLGSVGLIHGINPVLIGGDEAAAHRLRLRLLKAFPTRAPKEGLPLLDSLLFEALSGPDASSVKELARKKLAATSTTVGQRVRWLTVDAALSGAPGLRALKEFVDQSEIRARHLAAFLSGSSDYERDESSGRRSVASMLSGRREPVTLGALIEMLGASYPPDEPCSGGYEFLDWEVSDRVAELISELGSIAGDKAEQVLSRLTGDNRLATWRGQLIWAQRRQRVVNRDAAYCHPGIDQVQGALSAGAPANVVDLHALLLEHLADTNSTIRGANSNPWRPFWNQDSYGRPETPTSEEACRDALLNLIRPRLPSGVDLQPEGRYAADSRADIRASSRAFNVPIEIKKNGHRYLWRAVRSQLIEKYTTDPATSGYGIYLVLWFGADGTTRPPEGGRPATPQELQQRLERGLTPDEARKIAVIVIDVTKPGDQAVASTAASSATHTDL